MKTIRNSHSGFTLVELLVVISIIAMLASLLLPAINAAREQGRRAQCISNQRQVALALLNYEATKKAFPALRAPLRHSAYWDHYSDTTAPPADRTSLTWVSFLLPFIEQNTAWGLINSGNITDTTVYELVIPVMQCRSSGISSGENRISYAVNAGPQNPLYYDSDSGRNAEYGNAERGQKDAKMYTIFFDHMSSSGWWKDVDPDLRRATGFSDTKGVSVDNISSMDGTSMTILLSENENAGHWIWYVPSEIGIPRANWMSTIDTFRPSDFRPSGFHNWTEFVNIAICYPGYRNVEGGESLLSSVATGEIPTYIPLMGGDVVNGYDNERSPLFINEGRSNSGARITYPSRTARPSSGHPGVVVAAFCDQSTRTLRDDMDKTLFVRLCRPGCGVILNPKDLD